MRFSICIVCCVLACVLYCLRNKVSEIDSYQIWPELNCPGAEMNHVETSHRMSKSILFPPLYYILQIVLWSGRGGRFTPPGGERVSNRFILNWAWIELSWFCNESCWNISNHHMLAKWIIFHLALLWCKWYFGKWYFLKDGDSHSW